MSFDPNSRRARDERVWIKDPYRAGFIRKTFALFSIQVASLIATVVYIIKTFKKDINHEIEPKTKLHQFLTDYDNMWWACAFTVGCVTIPVCKKANRLPLPHYIGIPCWLTQTVTFCYMVAYTALYDGYEPKKILCWLICCIILAAFGATLGGWLMRCNY